MKASRDTPLAREHRRNLQNSHRVDTPFPIYNQKRERGKVGKQTLVQEHEDEHDLEHSRLVISPKSAVIFHNKEFVDKENQLMKSRSENHTSVQEHEHERGRLVDVQPQGQKPWNRKVR
jgi:hypothetical protein